MPWSASDVNRHNKGLSPKQKRQWVAVANSALGRGASEGSAIRQASAVVKKHSPAAKKALRAYRKSGK